MLSRVYALARHGVSAINLGSVVLEENSDIADKSLLVDLGIQNLEQAVIRVT